MVVTGILVYLLLESAQRTKGFDASALEVVLPLGDIPGIVWNRMGNVVTRHGGNSQDGNRAGTLKVDSLLVTGCE